MKPSLTPEEMQRLTDEAIGQTLDNRNNQLITKLLATGAFYPLQAALFDLAVDHLSAVANSPKASDEMGRAIEQVMKVGVFASAQTAIMAFGATKLHKVLPKDQLEEGIEAFLSDVKRLILNTLTSENLDSDEMNGLVNRIRGKS